MIGATLLCWPRRRSAATPAALANSPPSLDATGKTTGKLNYKTFIVFVALREVQPSVVGTEANPCFAEATAPFAAMLLTPPDKVEREDGKKVDMGPKISTWDEIKASYKLLITKRVSSSRTSFPLGS